MHLLYAVIHSDHIPMDAPLIHSHESSPLYNIAMFYNNNVVVSTLNMGFVCTKWFLRMCSVSTRGWAAEEHYDRVQFPLCGGLCAAESETRI